jgi:hypothetical protein
MPTITIEPELYQRIEKAALTQQSDIVVLLHKAVRHYLWELDRRKISEESKIYRHRHAELKEQYLDQYIAMHEGQIVDHDANFSVLRQRIRQKFGPAPIMITLVEDTPERVLTRHGFQLETSSQ